MGDVLQVPLSNLQLDGLTFSASRERQRRQTSMGNQIPRINLPPSLFGSLMSPNVGVFFTFYATPIFFPLAEGTRSDIIIGTPAIGATVANVMLRDLEENVTVVFQLQNTVSNTYIDHMQFESLYFHYHATVLLMQTMEARCVSWNESIAGEE